MKVTFPAMTGRMGQRQYFSTMMRLAAVPKMFTYTEWREFLPKDREQRTLNKKRIPMIAKYMTENEEGYLFASITASYKCGVKFTPSEIGPEIGTIEMDFDEATFVINDGQHRAEAIRLALQMNPGLGEETISVLLFPYENRGRTQQMFSDLNKNAAKTSKSLESLFDHRDPIGKVTLAIAELVPSFKDQVDFDAVSLPVGSTKMFSLAALYDANKELLRDEKESSVNALTGTAGEYWAEVSKHMPDWARVKRGQTLARELRQESISSHSVVLRAIGAVGAELFEQDPTGWKVRLHALRAIDWKKSNGDWEGVNIAANSVVSNRQARAATRAYLKQKLGLPLSETELRSITSAAKQFAADQLVNV
jgi:DNA sulfur modification protein DndB